jgi:hypothetical protein
MATGCSLDAWVLSDTDPSAAASDRGGMMVVGKGVYED